MTREEAHTAYPAERSAFTHRTAVLCFEADQWHCHRDIVLTRLSHLPAAGFLEEPQRLRRLHLS